MTHTKGKWTASIGECGATIQVNNDYNHPLTFSFSYPESHIDRKLNEEGQANANLITAAPELLTFAQKWIAFRNGEDTDPKELWFMATQAVAKAEGK